MASKPKKRKFKGENSRVLQRSGSRCEETVVEMKQIPPRVLVCQHDEVTKPISTVAVSWMKWTQISIVLLFHWEHEEPPGVARRAAIVWLEN